MSHFVSFIHISGCFGQLSEPFLDPDNSFNGFSGPHASLWRISNDMSRFQRYLQIKLGEESVSTETEALVVPLSSTWLFGPFVV